MLYINLNKPEPKPLDPSNQYTWMQKQQYDHLASQIWDRKYEDGNLIFSRVDGRFHDHCNWSGYEKLFKNLDVTQDKAALDFGCGLGKNLICYHDRFKQLDGVDLCARLVEDTKKRLAKAQIKNSNVFLCNGIDLSGIPDNSYDYIISTRCLQHIAVYSIRYRYLEEFYRVLKPGGKISIQMSFGKSKLPQVSYYRNYWNAPGTNGRWDISIRNPDFVKKDLKTFIGFKNFEYDIVLAPPYGVCGDRFWMFFRAQKPV